MEKINNFWVDNNGNKWNCVDFTMQQAEKNSNSLIDCQDCWHCQNCQNCQDCQNCRDCRDCWHCQNCQDCQNCRDCRSWKANPQKIMSDFIGSRHDQTTVYFDEERTEVVCGCFRGTLEEFTEAVKSKHGNNELGKQYQKFIAKVIAYRS